MIQPDASTDNSMIEVEQKFSLRDVDQLERQLARLGAEECPTERQADTYYQHPSRDFSQTREALRIRRVQVAEPAGGDRYGNTDADRSATCVTYKGPYLPQAVKSRPELEWRLDPCDPDGKNLAQLLGFLGLVEVLTVRKTRRPFHLNQQGRQLVITIDDAHGLGMFAEVETLAASPQESDACAALVTAIAHQLGLREVEKRSYLQMALQSASGQ